jgi:hypothetical protein
VIPFFKALEKDHSLFIKGNDQKWRVLGLKKCPLVAGFEVPTDSVSQKSGTFLERTSQGEGKSSNRRHQFAVESQSAKRGKSLK